MFKRAVAVAVVLVAALSIGSPVSAYCPSTSFYTCPDSWSCGWYNTLCVVASYCNDLSYCAYEFYVCESNNQYCTRGCLCW